MFLIDWWYLSENSKKKERKKKYTNKKWKMCMSSACVPCFGCYTTLKKGCAAEKLCMTLNYDIESGWERVKQRTTPSDCHNWLTQITFVNIFQWLLSIRYYRTTFWMGYYLYVIINAAQHDMVEVRVICVLQLNPIQLTSFVLNKCATEARARACELTPGADRLTTSNDLLTSFVVCISE